MLDSPIPKINKPYSNFSGTERCGKGTAENNSKLLHLAIFLTCRQVKNEAEPVSWGLDGLHPTLLCQGSPRDTFHPPHSKLDY